MHSRAKTIKTKLLIEDIKNSQSGPNKCLCETDMRKFLESEYFNSGMFSLLVSLQCSSKNMGPERIRLNLRWLNYLN